MPSDAALASADPTPSSERPSDRSSSVAKQSRVRPQGLQVSRHHPLEDLIVQGLLSNELLQPAVLHFQFLEPLGVVGFHAVAKGSAGDDRSAR